MKTMEFLKKSVLLVAVALSCSVLSAQPYHRGHRASHTRPAHVAVVPGKAVVVHVDSRFTQKQRLDMAVAYLHEHKTMKPKKYARMVDLPLKAAKAELEAFAREPHNPIARVKGKEGKLYRLRK